MDTDGIIRPAPLGEGALIRVVSPSLPSMGCATRAVDLAADVLAALGWRCDFARNADEISDDGLSAGTPEQRADDLNAAFRDDRVAAVMSAIGGSTSAELLPLLDADLIRSHPKPFVGRSDNTYINAFLLQECGLVSYNGVAFLSQFGEPVPVPETLASTKAVLGGADPVDFLTSPTRTAGARPWQQYARHDRDPHQRSRRAQDAWIKPGTARGRLVGGEIRIVADLLETGSSLTARERVLWLDVGDDEPGYFDSAVRRIADALDGPP
ncbi:MULTISPECIES: LD-carboxypeptidase [unclassified Nocardiopsis]|uniref:LD-carboxypeptidase n=1 Tax=unclassified Nocardiopsis TaxID=2649073 RepID=UPI0033CBC0CB